jgi:DNA polymerase-1
VVADYSSIEYRIAAELSGQEDVIGELAKGREGDPHRLAISRVLGIPLDEVTKTQRQVGKNLNYQILYDISPYGLAARFNAEIKDTDHVYTPEECREYIDRWKEQFSLMASWLEDQGRKALKTGFTRTLLGRRRLYEVPIPPKGPTNLFTEEWKEFRAKAAKLTREARNQPIQGLSADIMKTAMVSLRSRLLARGYDAQLVLTVHDELIVDSAQECADEVAGLVNQTMIEAGQAFLKRVPVEVEIAVGDIWAH